MARRGRKPKRKLNLSENSHIIRSLFSLLIIGLAGFSAIIIVLGAGEKAGKFGNFTRLLLTDTFGVFAFFVPVILFYYGLKSLGAIKSKLISNKILTGLVILFVSLTGITGETGGAVGLSLQNILAGFISLPGAIFLYVLMAVFAVVLITNKGIDEYTEKFKSLFLLVRDSISNGHEIKPSKIHEELIAVEGRDGKLLESGEKTIVDSEVKEINFDDVSFEEIPVDNNNNEDLATVDADYQIITPPTAPVLDESNYSNEEDAVQAELALLDDTYVYQQVSGKAQVNKLPFSNRVWEYPPLSLLSDVPNKPANAGNINERARAIEETLKSFGIKAPIADTKVGPSFTRYAVSPSMGTKASKIQNLATDLALRIKSPSGSVRIEAPIPGTNLVGIEVPNFSPSLVTLKSIMESEEMKRAKSKLSIPVGHDVSGTPVIEDIGKWPHCVVAGATGTGKSVMLNSIICALLFKCSPQECRFIMIDPKLVELSLYDGIPHLLTPVVTDIEHKAVSAFAWAVAEMERRYQLFAAAKVRNLEAYNELSGFQAEPYIVIVVDELGDMMVVAAAEIEKYIIRLAQKSRAVGIHLVLATQRPTVNILTGTIKANIPTRFAFKVTSQVDSRVVIDQSGAETLIGRGDMLFIPPNDSKPKRVQGVFVSEEEVKSLVEFLKNSGVEPEYKEEIFAQRVASVSKAEGNIGVGDEKMPEALEIIINEGKASASYLQRKLGLGYSRAARIIDDLEEAGVIGQARGSKPRDVLAASVEDALSRLGYKEK
jgi:DNA segregation ATPase FtsK/SpoIIIE, S-DNA-T family